VFCYDTCICAIVAADVSSGVVRMYSSESAVSAQTCLDELRNVVTYDAWLRIDAYERSRVSGSV
jgi:hypothetical protein